MEFEINNEKQLATNPLVSIFVITYNSSKYVLETLESAKAQTYKNIELIVSDDCSTDKTIEICREWIEENKKWFIRTELITVENNTGIPANCNRGVKASKGEWIKLIAGDDALLDYCISSNIDYLSEIPDRVHALHSDVFYYSAVIKGESILTRSNKGKELISNKHINAVEQLTLFIRGIVPLAPTVFFRRSVLNSLKGFDETLPYEDGPMWVKFASNNLKLNYLNSITVKYRLHDSVSNSKMDEFVFKSIFRMDKVVFEKVYRPYLSFLEIFSYKATFFIKDILTRCNLNRKSLFNVFLYKSLNYPFYMFWLLNIKIRIFKIKKRIRQDMLD